MAIRVVSGVIGIVLAAFIIQTGGAAFGAAVLFLMLIGWHEYTQAFRHKELSPAYWSGMVAMACFWGAVYFGHAELLTAAATMASLWLMLLAVLFYRSFSVPQALVSVAGVMYVGFSLVHLLLLRFWKVSEIVQTPVGHLFGVGNQVGNTRPAGAGTVVARKEEEQIGRTQNAEPAEQLLLPAVDTGQGTDRSEQGGSGIVVHRAGSGKSVSGPLRNSACGRGTKSFRVGRSRTRCECGSRAGRFADRPS